jgi:threonine/homoserine/homoserine lactone efflux protein
MKFHHFAIQELQLPRLRPSGAKTQTGRGLARLSSLAKDRGETAVPIRTVALFALAVLPLVITPGPDMLFVMSQGMWGGRAAALKASVGILLGYSAHALVAATGIAAIVAASRTLFEVLRCAGVCYLVYLAQRMIRSAMCPGDLPINAALGPEIYRRGFLSSTLNPKTLLVYLALLPSFIDPKHGVTQQIALLSSAFIVLCGIVYATAGVLVASAVRRPAFKARGRQYIEGAAGGLLMMSAVRIAVG